MPNNIKATGLLSVGFDSILALKLVKDQNVEGIVGHFLLPFADDKRDHTGYIASQLGMHLIKVKAAQYYIELLRHPSPGRGSTMNPYIDYRIYMLRQSRQVAQQIGACFFIAGDVLGQGSMTQQLSKLANEAVEFIV